jgi:hypothetical protein
VEGEGERFDGWRCANMKEARGRGLGSGFFFSKLRVRDAATSPTSSPLMKVDCSYSSETIVFREAEDPAAKTVLQLHKSPHNADRPQPRCVPTNSAKRTYPPPRHQYLPPFTTSMCSNLLSIGNFFSAASVILQLHPSHQAA